MRWRGRAERLPARTIHTTLATNVVQIVGNMLVTATGQVWAGYRIGPVRWDFISMAERTILLQQQADVWAALAGRDVQERVTTRPYPVAAWAKNLSNRTPWPAPDVPGETFNDYLLRMQRRIGSGGMGDKIVFRWFTLAPVEPGTDVRAQVLASASGRMPSAPVRALLADEKRVNDAVQGWSARRMSAAETGWMRARSLAPGMPAPVRAARDGWSMADLPELSNDVRWNETPFDRSVQVHGWRDGAETVRAVQVLTATRMGDQSYPENGLDPWQAYAEHVTDPLGRAIPVEWNLVGRIAAGGELAKQATLDLAKAININESYALFDEPAPEYTERGIVVAKEARDQITTGQARDSARFVGTVNMIVTGADVFDERGRLVRPAAEVVEERSEALRRAYAGADLRMDFTAPMAQAARLLEAVPGEGFDRIGYQRQMRLGYLAAGLPNVSSSVGDGRGPYLGYTLGAATRPVFHDSHYATEGQGERGRAQNTWLVVSTLGGGKSVLLESIIYSNVRRGTRVVVRDPSGPMTALCDMPELAGVSQALNLLNGAPGILNPPSLVRATDDEAEAIGQRRMLTLDMARRCLQPDLFAHPGTYSALREAGRKVAWTEYATLWDLVVALEAVADEHAHTVAWALRDASEMPLLRLLFPAAIDTLPPWRSSDALLTVISTPGVRRAPDGVGRDDWSPAEHAADPLLRLSTLYADRLLFEKSRDQRAVAVFDEAEDMTDSAAGRATLARLGRDHSKWNIAVYLALKNLTPEMMGGELRNFLAGAFVGRMANVEPAEAMLSVLHIQERGYAKYLMGLSSRRPGEFVHLDADGRVGTVKIDIDHHPELRDVALTNPTPDGADAWADEGERELV